MLKKPDIIQQVYNDGVIKFYSKVDSEDEYGTPIPGVKTEALKAWYRRMSARSQDIFEARSLGKDIDFKVAIRGNVEIDTKWSAETGNKTYEIYMKDYNPKNQETIISLKEV